MKLSDLSRIRRAALTAALMLGGALAQVAVPATASLSTPNATPSTVPVSVRNPAVPSGTPVSARVAQGALRGVSSNNVNYFLGIPYAAPPKGALRWQPPQPVIPWEGARDAAHYGNICPQRPNLLDPGNDNKVYGDENCLFLNVFAPKNAKNAPVMFWIHGGSFDSGSANQYDGSELARRYGVVVISAEYRLGALGFLAAPQLGEGNYGLMDLEAAMKWTRQNARAFGGNGNNLTVFGESAGGMAICSLLSAPSAQGLFDKAIMESGPCSRGIGSGPLNEISATGEAFMKELGCTGALAAACMRGQTVEQLLNSPLPGNFIPGQVKLPPAYGGSFLPQEPLKAFEAGEVTRVPILIGSNHDEGNPFTAYLTPPNMTLNRTLYFALVSLLNPSITAELLRQYPSSAYRTPALAGATLVTDGIFACPVNSFASAYANLAPTYRYEFNDPQPSTVLRPTASIPTLGAFHASEITYVFGTPLRGLADPASFSPAQAALSQQMGQYWTNFARAGNPNGAGLTEWPAYSEQNQAVLTLAPGGNSVNTQFAREHQCDFWAGINLTQR